MDPFHVMTGGVCIAIIGIAGAVVLPTGKITLSWTHTVEGTPWQEDYAVVGGELVITEARVKRSGAGMEVPDGAVWSQGWWHYKPVLSPLRDVVLANSSFAPGYTVCWTGQCRPLSAMVATGNLATLVAAKCDSNSQPPSN